MIEVGSRVKLRNDLGDPDPLPMGMVTAIIEEHGERYAEVVWNGGHTNVKAVWLLTELDVEDLRCALKSRKDA